MKADARVIDQSDRQEAPIMRRMPKICTKTTISLETWSIHRQR